ncbi:MAG TPA: HAD-IA family hydrolase [Paracoccus sp. (in: a-proteobacteria)]|uniref:HAD-IA family hydrolase n=1 Tax=uncultured Paracoccus sp. TaxID=189685 RepID=UPI002628F707|nr:HAD-IA family hydrolase [uncultured Paracoccus sp.]HMQ41349.1 HAD-IA family hydrolase [Paracoccus sp. (in: a-proteobacteria)]HMR36899.1 HAD-IA family hydrolase [Paracoccus sp. (in: a-proteobacteria)]
MAGTVVFDLDGTLAETSGDLIAAANAVLARRGLGALDPVTDAKIAGYGARAMLRAGYARASAGILIPPQAEDEDFPLVLDAYDAAIAVHSRLYPGLEAALARLDAAGFRLSVCTNKPEGLADKLLRELGVRDAFAALIGADTLPVRKPDPAPYRAAVMRAGGEVGASFLVGDTETDFKTARNSGVRVALVSFGPEGPEISRLKPDAMLDHYDALPELARGWLG